MSGSVEPFFPLFPETARLYHCGPTVYGYAHIGNLKKYVNDDTLRRALEAEGYDVTQVVNITDIGHLTSDADEGDDKMTVAIVREGLPMSMESLRAVADKYTAAFVSDIDALNILRPHHLPRASEWVPAQVELIERLFAQGLAYDTEHTVYFDAAQFPAYGALGHIDLEGQKSGARVAADPHKRSPHDFALWKKNAEFGFESPWGRGFPGWHIECSAMAMGLLGETIDIHTGGIDHIPVHHNNEIAQSEGATGKPFARYWLHSEFITIDQTKISKSLGNTITLADLRGRGFHPLSYRYWILTGHYRTQMNFSFEALEGAQNALSKLHRRAFELSAVAPGEVPAGPADRIRAAVRNDLNTAEAIAALWDALRDSSLSPEETAGLLMFADLYLGIGLSQAHQGNSPLLQQAVVEVPQEVKLLLAERAACRAAKDYRGADEARSKIEGLGFKVIDGQNGSQGVISAGFDLRG